MIVISVVYISKWAEQQKPSNSYEDHKFEGLYKLYNFLNLIFS